MNRLILLGGLLALAAGPLLAPALPAGPASLLGPPRVAAAAGIFVLLFLVFVWPALLGERTRGRILAQALEILAISLPFVVVLARVGGAGPIEAASAVAVLSGSAVVTGLWMAGPGADRARDRWFAAGAAVLLVVLPFANYALVEFRATATDVAFRLSPLLCLRKILLGEHGTDALPCLLLLIGIAALLAGSRVVRSATAVTLLAVLLAGSAGAAELEPVLGEFYVPGRPVPLGLGAGEEVREIGVRSGAGWTTIDLGREGRRWVEVPGAESLAEVRLRSDAGESIVDSGIRPVAPGTWLVVLGPAPAGMLGAAEGRGFHVGRAAAKALDLPDEAWLAVDGVIDVGARLDDARVERLRAAGLLVIRQIEDLPGAAPVPRAARRPWEEPGNILEPDGLADLFRGTDPGGHGDSRTAFLVCLGWAVVAGALLRWGRGRSRPRWILIALSSAAITSALLVGREEPPATERTYRILEGSRETTITRFHGTGGGRLSTAVGAALPLPLFGEATILAGGGYRLSFGIGPGERRLVVVTGFAEGSGGDSSTDLLFGPAGLAEPGQEWVPAGEYLRRVGPGNPVRAAAIRKLLAASRRPDQVYEIAFFDGGMAIRPSR